MRNTTRFGFILFFIGIFVAMGNEVPAHGNDDLIMALVNARLGTDYHEDGAADATVTAIATSDTSRQTASAEVRAIFDLGPRCIPLLIAHLDDQRLTKTRFDGRSVKGAPIQVPLGHICLDILLHATQGRAVHIEDCPDDGLGAGVRQGYYFRPDVLRGRGGLAAMRRVKARWRQAYKAKRIRFKYPDWLKRG
jgi:hypothetical protein